MNIEDRLPELFDSVTRDLHVPIDELYAHSRAQGRQVRRRHAMGLAAAGLTLAGLTSGIVISTQQPNAGTVARGTPNAVGTATASTPSGGTSSQTSQNVQVDLAAWSVHTNVDATVTVTLRRGLDLPNLRQTLARAGVHAFIDLIGLQNQKAWCTTIPGQRGMPRIENTDGVSVVTIYPATIPAGTELRLVIFSTVDTNAPEDPTTHLQPIALSMGLYTGSGRACVVPTNPPDVPASH